MNDAAVSAVLALSLVGLLAVSVAMLFFVGVSATISAVGLAREHGRERFALLSMVVPMVGWVYLIRHGRSVRWLRRYLIFGLACLAASALVSYSMLQRGLVTP